MSPDKMLHFFVCFELTLLLYLYIGTIHKTALVVFSIGVSKEVLDMFGYGHPEMLDLVADVLGISLASILIYFVMNYKINSNE